MREISHDCFHAFYDDNISADALASDKDTDTDETQVDILLAECSWLPWVLM